LRLKPLDELFDYHESNIEAQDNQKKVTEMQSCLTLLRNNQIHKEISYNDANFKNNEDEMFEEKFLNNENQSETREVIESNVQNKDENQTKHKSEISRGNKGLKNNFNLDTHRESFQTPSEVPDSKIIGEGSYQTSPENLQNFQILGGGNYQTSPENLNNHRITEKSFQTSFVNSTPVDCNEDSSNKTSLRDTTLSYLKESEKKNSSSPFKGIKFPRVGMLTENNHNTSHITIEELMKRIQLYNPNIKSSHISKKKNKPSSKIFASIQIKSQEMLEKFMRKRKSKHKERTRQNLRNGVTNDISSKCLVVSEEIKTNRLTEIIDLLRLEHLNSAEKKSIIKLITNSQDRFHIPGEKLTATNVLQHQIPTTDDRPINTRQYRFPQIHKEEINKQVEELLEGGIVKPSQSPYNTPIWIVPKKEDSKGNKRWRMVLDFRALNEKTIGDAYPLPNIVDILDQLGGARYFFVTWYTYTTLKNI